MRDIAKVFKALSDTNRLRIIKMLEIRPLCVCEIREVLNLANSTVSKHLSILRDTEFIIDEKDGKWVNYKLNRSQPNEYTQALLHLFKNWASDKKVVQKDRKMVEQVDRTKICGI